MSGSIVLVNARPMPPPPPTVRFWNKDWLYAFGCELLEPLERGAQPNAVRIHVDQMEAAELVRDQGDAIRHVTVDTEEGRYCGVILSWTIAKPGGFYVDALDVSRYVAKLSWPPMPAMPDLPTKPDHVMVTPAQVERLAERIVRALNLTTPSSTHVAQAYDAEGNGHFANLVIDGPVDFRKVAAHLLMHPEEDQ